MKHSQNPKRLLAIVLVLCTVIAVAFAAGFARKINTSIVVDGKMYNNVTNFEWDMEYAIPEGGLQWDGTPDFAQITYPTIEEIGDTPDGLKYVKGQLSFVAHKQGNIGAEFDNIEQLMASYGLRIIGYIAPGAFYQVETVEPTEYDNLQELKSALSAEETIIDGTVVLSILLPIDEQLLVSSSHDTSPISDETLWHGDTLDETNPMGANWGMEFINAPSVWRYDSIMNPVRCSIIDSGFDSQHTDLEFLSTDDNTAGDHGTHVAGIIAAEHNSIGVSGVFHNANMSGYHLTLFNFDLYPDISIEERYTLVPEVTYLLASSMVSGEPNVINLSQGFNWTSFPQYQQAILEASAGTENDLSRHFDEASLNIGEMLNNYLNSPDADFDFVVCQAAGNDKQRAAIQAEYVSYMAHISSPQAIVDRIIVVGAMGITQDGTPGHADFSQNGNRIDLLAPGVDIYSTITSNAYAYYPGTSMAAPHVSGVAACVWSIDPELTGAKVKQLVLNGANLAIEPDPSDTMRTNGNNYPLLNALTAVEAARGEARKGTINGTVTAYERPQQGNNNTRVPFASLTLYENDTEIASVFASENGEFTFKDVAPGIYTIVATKNGYLKSTTENIYLKANGTSVVSVYMVEKPNTTEEVEVVGTVVDTANSPLKGVTVSIKDNSMVSTTDENGGYLFELPVGTYTLIFEKTGYQTAEKEITIETDNIGWTYIVDAVVLIEDVQPDIEVTGSVVDESNNNIAGATVTVEGESISVTTNINGEFTLELPVGRYTLLVEKEGYLSKEQDIEVVNMDNFVNILDAIVLESAPEIPTVSGTVIDSKNQPLSDVTLTVMEGIMVVDEINVSGSFSISNLTGSEYTFVFSKEGYQDKSVEVNIGTEKEISLGDIVLYEAVNGKVIGTFAPTPITLKLHVLQNGEVKQEFSFTNELDIELLAGEYVFVFDPDGQPFRRKVVVEANQVTDLDYTWLDTAVHFLYVDSDRAWNLTFDCVYQGNYKTSISDNVKGQWNVAMHSPTVGYSGRYTYEIYRTDRPDKKAVIEYYFDGKSESRIDLGGLIMRETNGDIEFVFDIPAESSVSNFYVRSTE